MSKKELYRQADKLYAFKQIAPVYFKPNQDYKVKGKTMRAVIGMLHALEEMKREEGDKNEIKDL